MNWKRPLPGGQRIPRTPSTFKGTLRRYVDEHLEPAMPPRDAVLTWHEAVVSHAASQTTTLLVRSTPGLKPGDELTTRKDRRLRMTDNAPAWWVHAVAFSGRTPPSAGLESILNDVWCRMFGARPDHANAAGWYVAHILRAKPDGDGAPEFWSDEAAKKRFIRNISPLNHFLVPKGNGSDVGERSAVIATVADWARGRYGSVFDSFLRESGCGPSEVGRADWNLVVEMVGTHNTPAPSSATPPHQVGHTRPSPAPTSWWNMVLNLGSAPNRRAGILAASADAQHRLDGLTADLTVEQFVGLANALYNRCDPPDLKTAEPTDTVRQAQLAWSFLEDAKANPRLGGKWGATVDALRPDAATGLATIASLDLDSFVSAALGVVSQVYRRI